MLLPHRILIVEPGAPLQLGLQQQFARWGFVRVTTVETGTQALDQADVLRPDLVVLTAPKDNSVDASDLARHLQARWGPVPLLLLVPETWHLHRLPESWPGVPLSRCVPKPPTLQELQHGVEQSLHLTLPAVA
ncbi:response regulator [Hymenobacter sp. CRA2]|uniref:response regulator n=1 Tax=Hymenobacter sp. CRA2 TaxID=1955620 RepID=UPI00098EFF55|nr:response regulator [Hymenobacter sp. CRA2]OON65272.1 hypothetical protein B0919_24415 [Hymenobacter sp. CRA2]